jgi:AraC-like DNA-binding protein
LLEELALRLVAAVVGVPTAGGRLVKSQRDVAEAARCALHRDLGTPLAVADVAAEVGCSPFHACRVFAATTGMPLHRYRLLMKVRAAAGLVLETEQPLAAIAAATGFSDRSHLSRVLARHLGVPPLELRRRSRADLRDLLRSLVPG